MQQVKIMNGENMNSAYNQSGKSIKEWYFKNLRPNPITMKGSVLAPRP